MLLSRFRPRFTISQLMVAVAVSAILLAVCLWTLKWMSQPIPLPRYEVYK